MEGIGEGFGGKKEMEVEEYFKAAEGGMEERERKKRVERIVRRLMQGKKGDGEDGGKRCVNLSKIKVKRNFKFGNVKEELDKWRNGNKVISFYENTNGRCELKNNVVGGDKQNWTKVKSESQISNLSIWMKDKNYSNAWNNDVKSNILASNYQIKEFWKEAINWLRNRNKIKIFK